MTIDSDEQNFVLTIVDVFTLSGRGTVVIGPIESGILRTGEEVEIWDDHHLVASARAQVEMICSRSADPGSIGIMLHEVDKNLLAPGQTVRRTGPS